MPVLPVKDRGYARPELLAETDWLASRLNDPAVRVVDVRPADQYAAGHIPGAASLAAAGNIPRAANGDMGTPEEFAALAVRLGIGLNTMVVAYEGTQAGMLVWALRLHGHAKAAILDGGYVKWAAEGRSASREPVSYPAGAFSPKPLAESYCSLSQAKAFAGSKDVVFWDVRTPEEYLGKRPMNNTAPERNGHIPNAVNLDWNELFDPVTKTMKTAAECRAMLTRLGVKPEAEIVTY